MANKGNKKTLETNKRILSQHLNAILGVNVFYVLVRIAWFYDSFGFWQWVLFALSTLAYWGCYGLLASAARPTFSESGELLDGGHDLSVGGLTEYYKDILYVTMFTQVCSTYSDNFWFLWLVVPAFAGFKLWTGVIAPWIFAPAPEEGPMDEKTRKKLEKKEKKMNKIRYR
eukprot:Colp12_sorted_trinity150504_noHs@10112